MENSGISFVEFLSINRFLYDALLSKDKIKASDICRYLHISNYAYNNGIRNANIFSKPKVLQELARKINKEDMGDPPPVYLIYQKSVEENFLIDEKYLELLIPINKYHFDFKNLILTRFNNPISDARQNILNHIENRTKYQFQNSIGNESINDLQKNFIKNNYEGIPKCIRLLSNDEKFLINNELSVAFLHGIVTFPSPGISSPHLNGYFNFSSRKPDTGYLSLDSLLNSNHQIPKEKTKDVLTWLQKNNPLYKDFTPLTYENYHFRIDPSNAPLGSAINMAIIPNETGTTDQNGNVYIRLRKNDGNTAGKYIPLEEALPLCFPILFPKGVIKSIYGDTLRQKARFILGSHPYYRCGRLACHLILFLYSLIMDHDTAFLQSGLSIQRITIPNGSSRNIEPDKFRSDDPSFPTYWSHKQANVRAMCSQFGDPDLMMTFTFVNKWKEVIETENKIKNILGNKLDIRFCPLEEMEIWNNRFLTIKQNGFKDLINGMNFGEAIHFAWRLEFQARGSPHVHALVWLKDPLNLSKIQSFFFLQQFQKKK